MQVFQSELVVKEFDSIMGELRQLSMMASRFPDFDLQGKEMFLDKVCSVWVWVWVWMVAVYVYVDGRVGGWVGGGGGGSVILMPHMTAAVCCEALA